MSDGVQTLEPVVVAKEFFLVNELLDEPANTPLRRWLEYQAYVELVRLVSAQDALPDGYGLDALDMESIRDWIRGIRQLPFSFVERMKEILLKLKAAGSGIFDEIPPKRFGEIIPFRSRRRTGIRSLGLRW